MKKTAATAKSRPASASAAPATAAAGSGAAAASGSGATAKSTRVRSGFAIDSYLKRCEESGVQPNATLKAHFERSLNDEKELDLRDVYLGHRGCFPLISMLKSNPNLTSLNLRATGLRNENVISLIDAIRKLPLSSLNLSANAGISQVVGAALLMCLNVHPYLCDLNVEHTGLSALTKQALAAAQITKRTKLGKPALVTPQAAAIAASVAAGSAAAATATAAAGTTASAAASTHTPTAHATAHPKTQSAAGGGAGAGAGTAVVLPAATRHSTISTHPAATAAAAGGATVQASATKSQRRSTGPTTGLPIAAAPTTDTSPQAPTRTHHPHPHAHGHSHHAPAMLGSFTTTATGTAAGAAPAIASLLHPHPPLAVVVPSTHAHALNSISPPSGGSAASIPSPLVSPGASNSGGHSGAPPPTVQQPIAQPHASQKETSPAKPKRSLVPLAVLNIPRPRTPPIGASPGVLSPDGGISSAGSIVAGPYSTASFSSNQPSPPPSSTPSGVTSPVTPPSATTSSAAAAVAASGRKSVIGRVRPSSANRTPTSVAELLRVLKSVNCDVPLYLKVCQKPRAAALWSADGGRVGIRFVERLLETGYAAKALELAQSCLATRTHTNDHHMLWLRSYCLARSRNFNDAFKYMMQLASSAALPAATAHTPPAAAPASSGGVVAITPAGTSLSASIRGRLLMCAGLLKQYLYEHVMSGGHSGSTSGATPAQEADRLARESASLYSAAYQLTHRLSEAMNASTMFRLARDEKAAQELASRVLDVATLKIAAAEKAVSQTANVPLPSDHYKLFALVAEANIILNRPNRARAAYQEAVTRAGKNKGVLALMQRNLQLLYTQQSTVLGPLNLLSLFITGHVVVFRGQPIDPPNYPAPGSFPARLDLEHRISLEVDQQLHRMGATVGYVFACCGSDLLFAERMLHRKAELHVIVPFDLDEFISVSVDYGQRPEMSKWRARCLRVLQSPGVEVHKVTTEPYLGDTVLFDFALAVMQGLSLIRARELGLGAPTAVAVYDATLSDSAEFAFLQSWRLSGYATVGIDVAAVRTTLNQHGSVLSSSVTTATPASGINKRAAPVASATAASTAVVAADDMPAGGLSSSDSIVTIGAAAAAPTAPGAGLLPRAASTGMGIPNVNTRPPLHSSVSAAASTSAGSSSGSTGSTSSTGSSPSTGYRRAGQLPKINTSTNMMSAAGAPLPREPGSAGIAGVRSPQPPSSGGDVTPPVSSTNAPGSAKVGGGRATRVRNPASVDFSAQLPKLMDSIGVDPATAVGANTPSSSAVGSSNTTPPTTSSTLTISRPLRDRAPRAGHAHGHGHGAAHPPTAHGSTGTHTHAVASTVSAAVATGASLPRFFTPSSPALRAGAGFDGPKSPSAAATATAAAATATAAAVAAVPAPAAMFGPRLASVTHVQLAADNIMGVRADPMASVGRRPILTTRCIRYVIFGNCTNVHKLDEKTAPLFYPIFWSLVNAAVADCPNVHINTWSAGLYIIFDSILHCVNFAMGLIHRFRTVDWQARGMPIIEPRLGLHAGPLFPGYNPVMNYNTFFGSHVCRGARISAISPAGTALASEQFVAALTHVLGQNFTVEYIGRVQLAKGYDQSLLYRLILPQDIAYLNFGALLKLVLPPGALVTPTAASQLQLTAGQSPNASNSQSPASSTASSPALTARSGPGGPANSNASPARTPIVTPIHVPVQAVWPSILGGKLTTKVADLSPVDSHRGRSSSGTTTAPAATTGPTTGAAAPAATAASNSSPSAPSKRLIGRTSSGAGTTTAAGGDSESEDDATATALTKRLLEAAAAAAPSSSSGNTTPSLPRPASGAGARRSLRVGSGASSSNAPPTVHSPQRPESGSPHHTRTERSDSDATHKQPTSPVSSPAPIPGTTLPPKPSSSGAGSSSSGAQPEVKHLSKPRTPSDSATTADGKAPPSPSSHPASNASTPPNAASGSAPTAYSFPLGNEPIRVAIPLLTRCTVRAIEWASPHLIGQLYEHVLSTESLSAKESEWCTNVRLVQHLIHRLLALGQAMRAFLVAQRALATDGTSPHSEDPKLQYYRALSLYQLGNTKSATSYVDQLMKRLAASPAPVVVSVEGARPGPDAELRARVMCLAASIKTDAFVKALNSSQPQQPPTLQLSAKIQAASKSTLPASAYSLVREASRLYRDAFLITKKSYPAIHAATCLILGGDRPKAETMAKIAVRSCAEELVELHYRARRKREMAAVMKLRRKLKYRKRRERDAANAARAARQRRRASAKDGSDDDGDDDDSATTDDTTTTGGGTDSGDESLDDIDWLELANDEAEAADEEKPATGASAISASQSAANSSPPSPRGGGGGSSKPATGAGDADRDDKDADDEMARIARGDDADDEKPPVSVKSRSAVASSPATAAGASGATASSTTKMLTELSDLQLSRDAESESVQNLEKLVQWTREQNQSTSAAVVTTSTSDEKSPPRRSKRQPVSGTAASSIDEESAVDASEEEENYSVEAQSSGTEYTLMASLAEAYLVLRDVEKAKMWYERALQRVGNQLAAVATTYRNLKLLAKSSPTVGAAGVGTSAALPIGAASPVAAGAASLLGGFDAAGSFQLPDSISTLFRSNLGCVLVFAAHTFFSAPPKSPDDRKAGGAVVWDADTENRVKGSISKHINLLRPSVGYCTLMCAADVLFAEELLSYHGEVHVVLCFDKPDWLRFVSGDGHIGSPGAGAVGGGVDSLPNWRVRCDRLLQRAIIHFVCTEPFDERSSSQRARVMLTEFATTVMNGLALIRARQLDGDPHALFMFNSVAKTNIRLQGSAGAAFASEWSALTGSTAMTVIDLSSVVPEHLPSRALSPTDESSPPQVVGESVPESPGFRPHNFHSFRLNSSGTNATPISGGGAALHPREAAVMASGTTASGTDSPPPLSLGGEPPALSGAQPRPPAVPRPASSSHGSPHPTTLVRHDSSSALDDSTAAMGGEFRRVIRHMVFADVKGYSKLKEEQLPLFVSQFLSIVRGVMNVIKPDFANTWGDGLCLVFSNALDCARFAMTLLQQVDDTDWQALWCPAETTIRIGVHTGPVYHVFDTVIKSLNYLGRHVTVAESIEPITTPGCAFVSEQYAASLMVAQTRAQNAAIKLRAQKQSAAAGVDSKIGTAPPAPPSSPPATSNAIEAGIVAAASEKFSLQFVGATHVELLLEGLPEHLTSKEKDDYGRLNLYQLSRAN